MSTELRNSGISIVDGVPWGTHFCTFYETKQDLLDILVPFFKAGLESKEFCLWIISNSELLTQQEAMSALQKALPDLDRHLSRGSLELVEHDQWFLGEGTFDLYRVAQRFKEKLDAALAKGYVGMRLNGSPAWLYEEDQKELIAFEQEADRVFHDLRLIASCTYPITESGADELLDVAGTHQFVLTRRHGDWAVFETPELRQAKVELKKLNEELEQRVIERTRELRALSERLRSAREEEGTRIAREIHDQLGGALTSLRWDLEEVGDVISKPADAAQLAALLREHPLATLVTHGPDGLNADHVPFEFDAERQLLRGHVARANPLWRTADGRPVIAVFTGPQVSKYRLCKARLLGQPSAGILCRHQLVEEPHAIIVDLRR